MVDNLNFDGIHDRDFPMNTNPEMRGDYMPSMERIQPRSERKQKINK